MHKTTKSMELCHLLKHKSHSRKNFRASDEYNVRSVEKLVIHQNAEKQNYMVGSKNSFFHFKPHAAARILSCDKNFKSIQYPITLFLRHNQ